MHKVKEVIIVEGRYDKNALSQVVDATIIETGGFSVFNDKEKQRLIKKIAAARGIVIMTDPDGAGLVIRNFIKGSVPREQIKIAYVPPMPGKERRKSAPSKEGLLGVEGMRPDVLLEALRRSGAVIDGEGSCEREIISKADMFAKGLSGQAGSREKRLRLMSSLELPKNLSPDALLDVLNVLMSRDEILALDIY